MNLNPKSFGRHARRARVTRLMCKILQEYVVESTVGQHDDGDEMECKQQFFSTLDAVLGGNVITI